MNVDVLQLAVGMAISSRISSTDPEIEHSRWLLKKAINALQSKHQILLKPWCLINEILKEQQENADLHLLSEDLDERNLDIKSEEKRFSVVLKNELGTHAELLLSFY